MTASATDMLLPDAPLLLIAGPVPDDLPGDLAGALPGFRLLEVDPAAAADDPALRAAMAPARALLAPPEAVEAARGHLAAAGLDGLPVLALDAAPALGAALAAALAANLTEAQRDAGAARRSAALLRRETEEANRRLNVLERFIWGLGGPRQMQALHWPPAGRVARADAGDTVLTQRLPIDSPGIVAVDLWLPDAAEADARALRLTLRDSEGAEHPLPLDEGALRRDDGWLRFLAPAPIPGDRQDCSLHLTGAGPALGLGLGLEVPDPAFALDGAPAEDGTARTLALRVWRAIGGAGLVIAEGGAGRPDDARAQRLLPADMPRPSLLSSPREARDHVSTAFWPHEDAFLVHPSVAGPVCALLQRVPLSGISRLSAVIHAARGDGPPLAFALGIAPSGTITEENWRDHLGPWVTLAPGAWGEVHAPIGATPIGARMCDVALVTAVAGGTSNSHAWALFRAFRAVCRPST